MKAWSGSSKELEWLAKRTMPVFAFFAAVAGLVKLVGGPTWALIVFGVLAVVGPVADWLLKGRQRSAEVREERSELWLEPPARVRDLAATGGFYRLGVETEAPEALDAAGQGDRTHAAYVERDIDESRLRPALRAAASKDEPSLIVVSGPSKAGKSRTLLEATMAVVADAWLIAPKDAAALGKLARGEPPPEIADDPCVIWLDDIEPFVRPGDQGLSAHTLRALEDWNRPVLMLATAGGKGRVLAGADAKRFADPISDLITAHPPIELSSEQSVAEQARMSVEYSPESIRRIALDGIGEYMIVARRLIDRLNERTCLEGVAVVRAAIDWRRAGLLRPVPGECLQALYRLHLAGPDTAGRFEQGLLWATAPLYSRVALLQGSDPYEPYDYLVEHARQHRSAAGSSVWAAVIQEYATVEEIASLVGIAAIELDELDHAEAAFRRADERGDPRGAYNIGVLLLERGGDAAGAEAAYRRADERGHAGGAYNIGVLLLERGGDAAGAEAAYRRADERGDAGGAFNLGVLLTERGDAAGAEAAYRRADERGVAGGAFNLGVLLTERGDAAGAEAAYRRADERGHAGGAYNIGVLLLERGGDAAGAEAAYRRADERGDAGGAFNLGVLLAERGDAAGAEAAYRRAAASSDERAAEAATTALEALRQRRPS